MFPKRLLKSCKKRALGPLRASKWEPRSSPGDPRWVPKMIDKVLNLEVCSWDPLGTPKGHQNGTKMIPKWHQHFTKIVLKLLQKIIHNATKNACLFVCLLVARCLFLLFLLALACSCLLLLPLVCSCLALACSCLLLLGSCLLLLFSTCKNKLLN